jgi:hypothetical protein
MDNVWNTMPWVEDQLEHLGVPPPMEPNHECPVIMPGTLSTLSSMEYTTVYEKILGWFGYLTEKAAYAKSMVLQCENEMAYIETLTKKQIQDETAANPRAKKPTKDEADLRVQLDPRYADLKLISQKWRQLRDGLQARLETVEANMKVVSRHIEIRKLDHEGTNRQENMPGRNKPFRDR